MKFYRLLINNTHKNLEISDNLDVLRFCNKFGISKEYFDENSYEISLIDYFKDSFYSLGLPSDDVETGRMLFEHFNNSFEAQLFKKSIEYFLNLEKYGLLKNLNELELKGYREKIESINMFLKTLGININ